MSNISAHSYTNVSEDNVTFYWNESTSSIYDGDIYFTCNILRDNSTRCVVLRNAKRTTVSISIACCLFTLFLIVLFKKYTETLQRMIGNLSLAALLLACFYAIEHDFKGSNPLCQVQAVGLTFTVWACLLWNMCIMFNIYFRVIFDYDFKRIEVVLTLVCWLLPAPIAILPFVADMYGPAGMWCWLKNDFQWRFGCWYIWHIVSMASLIVAIAHLTVVMQRKRTRTSSTAIEKSVIKSDIRVIWLYPIVYLTFSVFPVIHRIENAFSQHHSDHTYSFVLLLMHTLSYPLYGASTALVYVLDTVTVRHLRLRNMREAVRRFRARRLTRSRIKEYTAPVTNL